MADVVLDPALSESLQAGLAAYIADWLVADRLPVRFQLQLHKILWGKLRGR